MHDYIILWCTVHFWLTHNVSQELGGGGKIYRAIPPPPQKKIKIVINDRDNFFPLDLTEKVFILLYISHVCLDAVQLLLSI